MTKVARTTVPRRMGDEIIAIKVSDATVRQRWHPQVVINALSTRLPLEQILRDIAALTGEARAQLTLPGSSSKAEALIRKPMPQLSEYKCQAKELDL